MLGVVAPRLAPTSSWFTICEGRWLCAANTITEHRCAHWLPYEGEGQTQTDRFYRRSPRQERKDSTSLIKLFNILGGAPGKILGCPHPSLPPMVTPEKKEKKGGPVRAVNMSKSCVLIGCLKVTDGTADHPHVWPRRCRQSERSRPRKKRKKREIDRFIYEAERHPYLTILPIDPNLKWHKKNVR